MIGASLEVDAMGLCERAAHFSEDVIPFGMGIWIHLGAYRHCWEFLAFFALQSDAGEVDVVEVDDDRRLESRGYVIGDALVTLLLRNLCAAFTLLQRRYARDTALVENQNLISNNLRYDR